MEKVIYEAIADTLVSHYMDPNYDSFLSYHQTSSEDYVTLDNGAKDLIIGYGTTLVQMRGGGGYRSATYSTSQDSGPPSNYFTSNV